MSVWTGTKVAEALERARHERSNRPERVTVDNCSEFCSGALEAWVIAREVRCFSTGQAAQWSTASSRASMADYATSV